MPETRPDAAPELDPAPADLAPTDPGPSDPGPTDPAPSDPGPTDPGPTDPAQPAGAGRGVQPEPPAVAAARALGVAHRVVRHGAVRSLAEAAVARGVEPADVVKTLVVRRGEGDHLLVLVPGDRTLSWPKLRALLGVSRLSLPDAAAAREVTGYERGTITPFGARGGLPVVADERLAGRTVTLGSGEHGSALLLEADDALAAVGAQLADVSEPEG